MRERAERKGYRNGTRWNTLESQVFYDPKVAALLPTPTARDEKNGCPQGSRRIERKMEQNYTIELNDLATMGMLPTPRANKVTDLDLIPSLGARGKHNLEEEIAKLLPTPTCNDAINQSLPKSQAERNDSLVKRILTGEMGVSVPREDGQGFRLSPLFTEEMMGFPFLWTTYPFLRGSGAPKHSKPTAMP